MDFINDLSEEAKVALGLAIVEKIYTFIDKEDDGYHIGEKALDDCWKWLSGKELRADDLCNYIDSEDYMDVAEYANKEKDEQKQYGWYSVLDAVSYTAYQAYRRENKKFVPQVLEVIDDETLIVMWENAIESKMIDMAELNILRKYLVDHYPSKDQDNNKLYLISKEDIAVKRQ
ncbi:Imm6 family immunity protein [Bacillus sp. PDNC022]|uniref:Imm6 family immunity protein n=1 Tax=Bacillus sp. PDNC022 TaxID=2812759 RepID=UPI0019660A49|nr:Imm6 family immunity protein [Bacillus sp. PDNC022]QRY37797.1 immunity protein imm6 [Bacillus sp. PDNC022]